MVGTARSREPEDVVFFVDVLERPRSANICGRFGHLTHPRWLLRRRAGGALVAVRPRTHARLRSGDRALRRRRCAALGNVTDEWFAFSSKSGPEVHMLEQA